MDGLNILADENIPLAGELFGSLGSVVTAPGRQVDEDFPGLDRFDVLAIRSVTRITRALVDRARRARVIATATIGADHIDAAYIREANARRACPISVLSAPGSNAESVADYILYALMHVTAGRDRPLSAMSIGIVGHGNCGSRVARRAEAFGMHVLRCDPPLAEREAGFVSDGLDETLAADFVSLHVPLTREGESAHPTWQMIGPAELARMRPSGFLLNASRGAVVDSAALVAALTDGTIAGVVLDVYEGEPEPAPALIEGAAIVTPHVAGYAVEAKRRGATVIYEGTCRVLGLEPMDTAPLLLRGFRPPAGARIEFTIGDGGDAAADRAVRGLLGAIHDIGATSRELKATLGREDRGGMFDAMRRNYERDYARHELALYQVGFYDSVDDGLRAAILRRLAGFGMCAAERPHYVLAAR